MDNGPEFKVDITNDWSKMHVDEFKYIQPGKSTQYAFVERFNGSYRRGVLDKYLIEDIDHVRGQTQIWMKDYNHYGPHDTLGKIPSVKYAKLNFIGISPIKLKTITLMKFRILSSSI